ncbi:MAG: hypothetical protein ACJZ70_07145 [Limisphaerales bacterium]
MADRLGEPKFTGDGIKGSIPRSSRFLPSALNELEDDDPKSTTDPRFLDAIHVYKQFLFLQGPHRWAWKQGSLYVLVSLLSRSD